MPHRLVDLAVNSAAHAPAAAGAVANTANTVSITSLLFQLVVGLGVVLGVIALVAKVLRGRAGMAIGAARRQGVLAVIGRQSLTKGTSVAVVRAGQRVFLLGITPQSVRSLAELDPAELDAQVEGGGPTETYDGANGIVAAFPTTKQRPTTTWMSTIEQLRELTVRRA